MTHAGPESTPLLYQWNTEARETPIMRAMVLASRLSRSRAWRAMLAVMAPAPARGAFTLSSNSLRLMPVLSIVVMFL